ncbi:MULTISPECIES: dioxygenase [Pseudomonas]|uniref:6-chlorohydroxyquinol-1,2-dioxygenase n=1 Tax=Pseudomonas izuensis TaxID=2684212 RepID=A0ABM7S0A6_9PSED|nr:MULTISPECIES: dioxygenase [Pseudomonas]RKS27285.1 hydroxyquinol 1,2-dioxygenase [Pseudomonas sp. WPR_5_2]BCX68168.1 6-chlorohydroxyquinol-1,2-dioxygenase [Pseudomonas izuensis]
MTDQDRIFESLISEKAVNSFNDAPNARYKQIMQSLVRHLHAFVSDVELTEQEWFEGIGFLTDTGHKCDGLVRQEFILLSDTLGVSMLVDAINHRHSANATETTVFGPFYIEGMPEREFGENMAFTPGEPALVRGRVVDTRGNPLGGAVLDVWQTAENGMYSGQDSAQPFGNLRGRYRTNADGYFAIRTIVPVCYPIPTDGPVGRMLEAANRHPWRPAHLHFMIEVPGYRKLVTHLFNRDDPYLESDAVFGVKQSLQVIYEDRLSHDDVSEQLDIQVPFKRACYEFVMEAV